jgi:hypothetical protein
MQFYESEPHAVAKNSVLRIRDVYPESSIPDPNFFHPGSRVKKIPDPGSAPKNLSIFNPKNCFKALGNMIRDVHHDFLSIEDIRTSDPGVKKAPDPGSGSATLQKLDLGDFHGTRIRKDSRAFLLSSLLTLLQLTGS